MSAPKLAVVENNEIDKHWDAAYTVLLQASAVLDALSTCLNEESGLEPHTTTQLAFLAKEQVDKARELLCHESDARMVAATRA